jgi:YD repeat-containing protein
MKTKIILVVLFCQVLNIVGQNPIFSSALDLNNFEKNLTPQVAMMNRYGDYPVDLQNGLVDISIPLYTVQTPGLTMPLQLKFHASGLRADEREGLLGIRWVLAGGGQVTRTIKGYPDDYSYPFNSLVSNPNYVPDFNTLYGTTSTLYKQVGGKQNTEFTSVYWLDELLTQHSGGSYKDTEYDIFSYSLPSGKSGKFILKDNNGTRTACLMPYEPMQVNVNKDSRFTQVTIMDEDGVTYRFGEIKRNSSYSSNRYVDSNAGFPTAWHLSSIISANKKDTILIDYINPSRLANSLQTSSLVVSGYYHDYLQTFHGDPDETRLHKLLGTLLTEDYFDYQQSASGINTSNTPTCISSVQFRSGGKLIGRVDFSYANNKYLHEMVVRDALNNTIKKTQFVLKNNQSGNSKLLDKIEFLDMAVSDQKQIYTFSYYDSSSVPACGSLSLDSDWWGYYSLGGGWFYGKKIWVDRIDNTGTQSFVEKTIPGGHKQTNEASMKIGMIQSIHYPTGGSTEFEYEANRYGTVLCGGLRIKKIKNIPESGTTEVKRYEYGASYRPNYFYVPENLIFSEIEMSCYSAESYGLGAEQAKYTQRFYQNTFPGQYTEFHSNIVYYPDVTEYIENSSGANIGKTVYKYNISMLNDSYFNSLNDSDFTPCSAAGDYPHNTYNHRYVSPKDFWSGNKLQSKTIYNASGHKVKQYIYDYDTFRKESVFDLPVYRYRQHLIDLDMGTESTKNRIELCMITFNYLRSNYHESTFAIKHQEYTIGVEKLVKETEWTYSGNDSMAVIKAMSYEPTYLLQRADTIINSNGKHTVTAYKYPFDEDYFDDDQFNPYYQMVSKNILSPVVEQSQYTNNQFLNKTIVEYKNWGSSTSSSLFAPQYILKHFANQPASETKIRTTYHNYDSQGRPIYFSKDGAENIVYIWSYNHQYPVALIQNATYDQVKNALGGETFVIQLADKLVPTDTDLTALNNLRTSLPQAQVSTYTYRPLVGVLTATDPSGKKMYYQYNGFGKLQEIYLMNNNQKEILKHYEYNYAN